MKKLLLLLLLLPALAACFAMPVEDPVPLPPRVYAPTPRVLNTALVTRTDVVLFTNAGAFYVPAREELLFFPDAGFRVEGIFVGLGDYVRAGDIISSLYFPNITVRYEAALRQNDILRLALSQVRQDHERVLNHAEQSGNPVDDSWFVSETARLVREIELLTQDLAFLSREEERRHVRSPIDGRITSIMIETTPMTSNVTSILARVADHTQTVFEVRSADVVPHMHPGDVFTIMVDGNEHEAIVVDPDEEGIERDVRGNEVYLVLLDDTIELSARPIAHIVVERARAVNALVIPFRAVNRTEYRTFVFVLDENNIMTVRDVVLGLRGNNGYEVISGLSEGEIVVL